MDCSRNHRAATHWRTSTCSLSVGVFVSLWRTNERILMRVVVCVLCVCAGVEVFSRERVRGLSGVEVKTVINGDFVKKPRKGSTVVLHYIAFYSTDHTHGKMYV